MIERININEIETEILDERKVLEKIKAKLRKLETKIIKKDLEGY